MNEINSTLNQMLKTKKILVIKDDFNNNSYIDLQRKLMHMDYDSGKISLMDAMQYEDKFIEFKKDIDCKCNNNDMIRKIIERSTNTPDKLYQFVTIDNMYKNIKNNN